MLIVLQERAVNFRYSNNTIPETKKYQFFHINFTNRSAGRFHLPTGHFNPNLQKLSVVVFPGKRIHRAGIILLCTKSSQLLIYQSGHLQRYDNIIAALFVWLKFFSIYE